MEVRDFLDILRRRWLSIAIVALTALALASLATLALPKKYTAETRIFFAVAGESVSELEQGSSFAEKQMASYVEVATSPLVLGPVVERLALPTTVTKLEKSVEATVPPDTVILEIAATDRDPQRAAAIANAVGAELGNVAGNLSPSREDGSEAVRATTLAVAQVPTTASSPNILRNLGAGLIFGLVLGIGIAVLRELLDTKLRREQDVRAITDSPILGVVAFDQKVPRHPVIMRDEPLAAPSEAVRRLRTNLQFIDVTNRPRSIVISSSIPGEGKSTIAMNLAVSMADTGARVILVDADLRRPSMREYFGIEDSVGLTTVLIGRADVEDVVQPLGTTTLDLLPVGQIPPNPSEVLGSPAMAGLLDRLTESYDTVLLDSPPLLPVTDAAVLTKLAGGALVVVGADRIHRPQLQEALASLETAGAHVLGIVINKIDRREVGTYSAYYGGGYAFTGSDQSEADNIKSKTNNDQSKADTDQSQPDTDQSQPDTDVTTDTDQSKADTDQSQPDTDQSQPDTDVTTDTDQSQPHTDLAAKTDTDQWPLLTTDNVSDSDETVEMDLRLRPKRLPAHTR
ncbi:MAG TPA: polysaccharide biosynthesis tyrosine autokinase [Propionibacteriaceae bacterium]|nr:polysaccharide biosynthesis tyrosine autokinase [Propionibacteriaceae bacterium]